jgi:hypothetical protein
MQFEVLVQQLGQAKQLIQLQIILLMQMERQVKQLLFHIMPMVVPAPCQIQRALAPVLTLIHLADGN